MKIERSSSEIKISQEKYIEKKLETFKMNICRPIGTPLEENCNFQKMIVLRRGVRSILPQQKS